MIINHFTKYFLLSLIYFLVNYTSVSSQTWLSSLKQFGQLFEKLSSSLRAIEKPKNPTTWHKTGHQNNNWINNQVPFVFHQSCNQDCRSAIKDAISDWERYTCIKFLDWGDDEDFDEVVHNRFYIKFRADQPGCFTVLRKNRRHLGQSVNLGQGCLTRTKILHELGHVLHLDHVHGRPDRDLYIDLKKDNIYQGFEDQYELRTDLWESVPYDYRSIMHYQSSDFSVSPFKLITMSTRSPNLQYLIDEPRQGLSFYDIKQVNLMYNCTMFIGRNFFCLNQGISLPNFYNYNNSGTDVDNDAVVDDFIKINDVSSHNYDGNRDFKCLCPPEFIGSRCEIPKYDQKFQFNQMVKRSGASGCGQILKSEGSIQTMDYPRRSKPFDSCSWIINAPKGYRIELFFKDFWFDEPTIYLNYYTNRCVSERVEIRCIDPYQPEMYCGRQLNNTVITSRSNYIIVNVIAGSSMIGRGFSATFKFIR